MFGSGINRIGQLLGSKEDTLLGLKGIKVIFDIISQHP